MGYDLAPALEGARRRIASAGGNPARVKIVAVTKGFGVDAVKAALDCGIGDIGENYAQELVSKADDPLLSGADVRWHFLGALQRNKLSRLASRVHLFHGLAATSEAEALAARAPGSHVLVEVDFTGKRRGSSPDDAGSLVRAARRLPLVVRGLMTVAPPGGGEPARSCFARLAAMREELGLEELSMGMTDDLEEAVAAGATMVRLGRALFGPRPEARSLSR